MSYIDEIAVERAYRGDRVRLNLAERRELWQRLGRDMARDPDVTPASVARRLRVSRRTVDRRIAALRASGQHLPRRWEPIEALNDKALLRRLYVDEQRSMADIALRMKCNYKTVGVALRRHGIPIRTSIEQRRIVRDRQRTEALRRVAA